MKKLLLTMAMLTGFTAIQANPWDDFKKTGIALGEATYEVLKETAENIKKNSWDKSIGDCKNGGKVCVITLAAVLTADQIYCWYVNKEIMRKFNEQKQSAYQAPVEKSEKPTPNKKLPKTRRGA